MEKKSTMEKIIHKLWSGNISIGFYVFNSDCYWVIYTRNDFSLNVEIEYQAYLNKGVISPEQYNSACLAYRGGVLDLNKDTFNKFLALPEVQVCSIEYLKELFFFNTSNYGLELLGQKCQNNLKLNEEEQRLRYSLDARFPLFYTNFNSKQFYHLENDRSHEALCNPDWKGENKNFLYLIPEEYRYWFDHDCDYAEMLQYAGI